MWPQYRIYEYLLPKRRTILLKYFLLGVPTLSEVSAEPQGCYVNLSWETPSYNSCNITRYTVHYRQPNQLKKWQTTSFREPNIINRTEYRRLKLNCSSTYEIMVLAWNERGSSINDAKRLTVKTRKGIRVKAIVSRLCARANIICLNCYIDAISFRTAPPTEICCLHSQVIF